MRLYRLTNQERAGSGFTHQFVIEGSELTADNVAQTVDLITISESSFIDDNFLVRVDEAIAGPAANVGLEVGVTGDPNYRVLSSEVKTSIAAGTLYTTLADDSARGCGDVTASNTYTATFTSSSGKLNVTTNTGKVSIFMRILGNSELGSLTQA
jgi:hypothetical protein